MVAIALGSKRLRIESVNERLESQKTFSLRSFVTFSERLFYVMLDLMVTSDRMKICSLMPIIWLSFKIGPAGKIFEVVPFWSHIFYQRRYH